MYLELYLYSLVHLFMQKSGELISSIAAPRTRIRLYIYPLYLLIIQLLESPIPTPTTTSQKASSGDISVNKRGIIDPLVSKRPEKF